MVELGILEPALMCRRREGEEGLLPAGELVDRRPGHASACGGKSKNRDLAVGFLGVAGVRLRLAGDPRVGLLALLAGQRLTADLELAIPDLDRDLVRVLGDVVEPRRV